MCLLIALSGVDPEYPLIIAGNRDEDRERRAAPPGLFVGRKRRILSPRDRRADGTWQAINDIGMFAGLTNLANTPLHDSAPSRGLLPHLALDGSTIEGAVERVTAAVHESAHNGFQLLLADGERFVVLAHDGAGITETEVDDSHVILTNEHRLGELELEGLDAALEPELSIEARLELLAELLLDTGERSGHRVLKRGGNYGTVSSSLIAIRPEDPRALIWRYAPGPPDEVEYRNYGNLSRRLVG